MNFNWQYQSNSRPTMQKQPCYFCIAPVQYQWNRVLHHMSKESWCVICFYQLYQSVGTFVFINFINLLVHGFSFVYIYIFITSIIAMIDLEVIIPRLTKLDFLTSNGPLEPNTPVSNRSILYFYESGVGIKRGSFGSQCVISCTHQAYFHHFA